MVLPTIGTDLINLAITVRILNVVAYADNGRPVIVRRTTDTHIKAKDGQEVVLGGMVHETALNTTRKVPVLGSIPVIGYLFGGESKQTNKRLVVLVVKPTLVTDYKGITESQAELIEKAKGNKAIKIADLKAEYKGDPPK